MNRPIVMAQLGGATATQAQSVRVIKLAKPGDSQAQTVYLGYEQKFKIDLSAIANEKLTFVHIGEKLIILFDNQSTLTIDPFFDAAGAPRNNIAFDVNGREIDGGQFASTFPITTDQSVLPAAGDGAGGPASGGNFRDAAVDPFASPDALDLLGQEELGNLEFTEIDGPPPETTLPTLAAADRALLVDDQNLANGSTPNGPDSDSVVLTFTAGTDALTSFFIRDDMSGLSPNLSWDVSDDGQQLIGSDERGAVVRITLIAPGVIGPGQDGAVTVTVELLRNFDTHPGLNVDDLFQLGSLTVVGSGANGAVQVSATVSVAVSDDVPSVSANAAVQLDDESATPPYDAPNPAGAGDVDPDTANLTGTLGFSFNADDAGSVQWVNALVSTGGAAGLSTQIDAAGSLLIIQDQNGNAVTVMTVTLDPLTGAYTVTQNAPLFHAPGNDENDQQFTLTYVVTDGDGDTASGTLTINVDDDTPTIEVTAYQEGEGTEGPQTPFVYLQSLDESIGPDAGDFDATFDDVPQNETPDPTGTNPIGQVKTSPGGSEGEYQYPGQLYYLFNVTASPGADGASQPIAQNLAFTLTGGVSGPGVATTLTNTALSGIPSDTIYLFQISATEIIGVVGNDPAGDIALRIELLNPNNPATAQIVVSQYLPIDHGNDANNVDSSLAMTLVGDASLGLTLTATIIDDDGDPATSSATIVMADSEISSINIQDDGPSVDTNAVVYLDDETATTPEAAPNPGGADDYPNPPTNFSGTLAHTYGSDGAGTTLLLDTNLNPNFTYTLSPDGRILTISQVQDGSPVDVLRVTLSDLDSGAYTVEQLRPIDHPTAGASEEDILFDVNYRVTDGDGDTIDGVLKINVDDDTPTLVADDICEDVPGEPGDVANFVLVLDTSGSIGSNQLDLIQDAVQNLLNQIGSSGAQDVRIHIVQFDTTASAVGTYDIIVNGALVQSALDSAINDVNNLDAGGNTNYEAGLQQSLQFVQGYTPTIAVTTSSGALDANQPGGGNDTAYIIGNGSTQIAYVTAWTAPGQTNAQLQDVGGSLSDGFGVNDDNIDESLNQMLRFDFGAFNNTFDGNTVPNFVSNGFNGVPVVSATFELDDETNGGGNDTDFNYKIVFTDGTSQSGSESVDGASETHTLAGTGANAGKQIAYIEFTVGNNDAGNVELVSVTQPSVPPGTLPNADVNSLIFISDGEPNTANGDNGGTFSTSAQNAINQILGSDGSNEVGETEGNSGGLDQAFTIQAYHVGSPTVTLSIDGDDDNNDANAGGGDDDVVILYSGSTAIAQASGWSSASLTLDQLVDANGGTGGLGVQGGDSDELDSGEVLRIDFGPGTDYDNGGTNYSTLGFNGPLITSASFEFEDFGNGSHTVGYRVFYTDGTSDPAFTSVNFSGDDTTRAISAPAGKFIDYIEFVNTGSGNGQIDLQSVVIPNPALSLLDQVEGPGGDAVSITAPGDLASSLSQLIASLAGTPGSGDCGPIVVHDETSGIGAQPGNPQNDVAGSMLIAPAVTIASLFAGVVPAGADPHATLDNGAIGFARSGANVSPVTFTASFGADGPATNNPVAHALSISGANGTVWSGLVTTDNHKIYLFEENGLIVGRVDHDDNGSAAFGNDAAFAIAMNPETGELYVAQYLSLRHPAPGASHDEQVVMSNDAIRVTVTITDHDHDQVSSQAIGIGKYIGFADDGPNAQALDLAADTLVLDETRDIGTETDGNSNPAGRATVTANFADNFASVGIYGSDGPGTTTYALTLSGSNVSSGLFALGANGAPGTQIQLNKVGNDIVGTANGNEYIRISVNATTGVVTFSQSRNVWHADTGNDDDASTLTLTGNDLLQIVQTVTDADGDVDTAAVNLGSGVFQIEDDGPNAQTRDVATDKLVLDESPSSQDTGGDASPSGRSSTTANFADNFVPSIDYGSDGPGSVSYALTLSGSNINSGLFALGANGAPGTQIQLNKVGNDIVGTANGNEYIRISVNATTGVVTFTQSRNVWHANASSDDDTSTLTLSNGDLLRIAQTVKDADGDSDTAYVNLSTGVFEIEDDGPDARAGHASNDLLILDETRPEGSDVDGSAPNGRASTTANYADNFSSSAAIFGTDGPGSISYALLLTGSNVASGLFTLNAVTGGQGASIVLNKVGNDIVGTSGGLEYVRISVDSSGVITFTQLRNVYHANAGNDDDTSTLNTSSSNLLQLEQKVTDADGDSDFATINIGHDVFKIQDDGPSIVAGAKLTVDVYEDGLNTANSVGNPDAGRPGEMAPSGAASFTAPAGTLNALVNFGTDGPHPTQAFSLASQGPSSFLGLTSNGGTILVVSDGLTLRGYVDNGTAGYQATDRLVFTLTVTPQGGYTFTLLDQIDHPPATGTAADNTENSLATPINLSGYIVAKDGDGDSVTLGTGAFVVTIQDDVPIQLAGNTSTGKVEEEHGLPGGNEDLDDASSLDSDTNGNLNAITDETTGVLSNLVKVGADEVGTFGINTVTTGLPALTSLDQPILYHVNGTKLTAYVNTSGGGFDASDRQIFTLEITNTTTGAYKFTLIDNIDHHSDVAADHVEGILALNLSSAITFTDRDGDTIVLSGGQNGTQGLIVTVIDDVLTVDGKICLTSGTGVAQYGANPADMLYAIPAGTGLTIDVTNLEEDAGYNNSLGYVFLNAAGQPIGGVIIEDSVDDSDADRTITIPAGSVPAGAVMLGFFIIPGGSDLNDGSSNHNLAAGDAVTFQQVSGNWVAFYDGNPLSSAEGHVLFSDRRLNPDLSPDGNVTPGDDFDHNTSNGTTSNGNWEDTVDDSDKDFNDLEFTVTVCATAPNIVAIVDEDGLAGRGLDGSPLRPGETDGLENAQAIGVARALTALVSFGADGPHATEAISLAAITTPQPTGLKSQNGNIVIVSVGGTLTGYVEGDLTPGYQAGNGDRAVFTFTVTPQGGYTFTLLDQIDHPTLDGVNPGDNSENLLADGIDLSSYIVAKDGDGDKITLPAGTFKVQVLDDIPVASGFKLTGQVDEDEMNGSPFNDNSVGIQDEGPETDEITFTAAQVLQLVSGASGADQPVTVILNANVSGNVTQVGGGNVLSQGKEVVFGTDGADIVGYVDVSGAGFQSGTDREVFRITRHGDGSITFDLRDQIDHQWATGELSLVELNLSAALLLKDFDGDTTALPSGLFTISVENDIPANTALSVQVNVGEDELDTAPGTLPTQDQTTGIPSSAAGNDEALITNAMLQTLVKDGADEEVIFSLNTQVGGELDTLNGEGVFSHGGRVRLDYDTVTGKVVGYVNGAGGNNLQYDPGTDRVVFRITNLGNGDFEFDLIDKIDHYNDQTGNFGLGDAGTMLLDISTAFQATDYDGDVVVLGLKSVRVSVENDVPTATINPDARILTVDETFLGGAGATDSASAASFFAVNYGADGPGNLQGFSLSLAGSEPTGLVDTETGTAVTLHTNGSTIEGRNTNGDVVFTLSLDGSNNVVLTQLRAVMHGQVGSNPLTDHDDPEFLTSTGLIKLNATVTDFDLDSVPVSVSLDALLRFEDDGPTLVVTTKEGALASLGADTEVDETTNDLDNSDADDDRYNTGEVEDAGGNPNNDDGAGYLGRVITGVAGGIHNLFDVTGSFGADGPGALTNGPVSFGGLPTPPTGLATNLQATDGGLITLYSDGATRLVGKDTDGHTVFEIEIVGPANNLQIQTTLFEAIRHTDANLHDNEVFLKLAQEGAIKLLADFTRTDKEGDSITVTGEINLINDANSIFSFDDDGPKIISVVPDVVVLGTELIVNGSFENGHGVTNGNFGTFYSITGWNAADRLAPGPADDIPFEIQQGNVGDLPAHTGSSKVELDSDTQPPNQTGLTNSTIQQAIATAAGEEYQLSFWFSSRPNTSGTSGMDVFFDGQLVLSIPPNNAFTTWTQFTVTVTAIDSSSVLSFTSTGAGEELGAYLDDVSLRHIISSNVADDEDTTLNPAIEIQGGPGDDGAGVISSGKINFDAGEDGLASIVLNGPPGLSAIWVDGSGIAHQQAISYIWSSAGAGGTLYGVSTNFPNAANPVFAIAVDANGNYTFTQKAPLVHPATNDGNAGNGPEVEWEDNLAIPFGFTITDRDGDTATGQIAINVDDDTPDSVAAVASVVLDDEAQVFGIPGDAPLGDQSGANVASVGGTLAVTAGADGFGSFAFAESVVVTNSANGVQAPLEVIQVDPVTKQATIEQVTLDWVPNGNGGTLYGFSTSYPDINNPAFTLTVDATGGYTFTAFAPLNHPFIDEDLNNLPGGTEWEDELKLAFTYTAKDGDGDATTNTLTITVDDDTPDAADDVASVEEGGGNAVNLVIVLDVSGSMAFDPNVDGYQTRLELAQNALENLINAGNVNSVFLVTFDSAGHFIDSGVNGGWFTPANAIAAINGLLTGSGTDYDAALAELDTHLGAPPAGGTQTIMYFISDGQPNENNGTGSDGIDPAEEIAFDAFLAANNISQSIAVGIGANVSATNLNPLATSGTAIIIDDENDLIGTITGTLPGLVTGNVLENDGTGADGLRHIASITVDGDLYTYNGADILKNGAVFQAGTSTLALATDLGGEFTFHFKGVLGHPAGDWQYLSPQSGVDVPTPETFTYVIVDGDGDNDSATLTITVQPSPEPIAADAVASVDDDGLAGNNPASIAGDLDANAGESPASLSEAVFNGSLAPNFNGETPAVVDPIKFIDTTGTVGTENVTYTWDPSSNTLTAKVNGGDRDGLTLFTVQVDNGVDSGAGAFKVTLVNPISHAPGDDENDATVALNYRLTDANLDTDDGLLTITFDDDAPTAFADTDLVSNASNQAAGNVITAANITSSGADAPGADGAEVSAVSGANGSANVADGSGNFTVLGAHGTLVINQDGGYTYTRNSTGPFAAFDTFTYTLTDGDGDASPTTLTIQISDAGVTLGGLAVTGGEVSVDEDDLASGSDPSKDPLTQPGSFSISAPNGIDDAFVGTYQLFTNGTFNAGSLVTPLGNTLTFVSFTAGVVGYTYTLNAAETHPTGGGENDLFESLAVTVTDTDGDLSAGQLDVRIVDDVPDANDDTDTLLAGQYGPISGSVITGLDTDGGPIGAGVDVPGADGVTVVGVAKDVTGINLDNPATVGVSINGDYGVLTIGSDGTYTYTRNPNTAGGVEDEFTYTIKDSDGDLSHATLIVKITDSNVIVTVPAIGSAGTLVHEQGMPTRGSEPEGSAETQNLTPQQDSESVSGQISYQLNDVPATVYVDGLAVVIGTPHVGEYGTLTITAISPTAISYTYTLTDNVDNDTDATPIDDFVIRVADVDNDFDEKTLTITIGDDGPIATADANSVSEGGDLNVLAGAGVLANDIPGADGFAPGAGVVGVADGTNVAVHLASGVGNVITTALGKLTLQANGSYTYESFPNSTNATAVDHFVYTVKDQDGSLSTTTLDITINPSTLAASNDDAAIVNEAALDFVDDPVDLAPGIAEGSNPVSPAETDATRSLADNVSGGVGPYSYMIVGLTTGQYGVISLDPVTGAYTYTLTKPVDGPTANDGPLTEVNADSFDFEITDANGNVVTGKIFVDIVDDVPTAKVDAEFVVLETSGPVAAGNLLDDDVQGADGASVTHVSFDGVTYVAITTGTPNAGGFGFSHPSGNGTIVVHADGTWTFDPAFNAATSDQQADFWYRITDGDGDVSSAKQDVLVTNANAPLTITGAVTNVVEEEHINSIQAVGNDDLTSASTTPNHDQDTAGNLSATKNVVEGAFAPPLTFAGLEGTAAYSLALVTDGAQVFRTDGVTNLTSQNQNVVFVNNGGVLTGYVNVSGAGFDALVDRVVFTLELNQPAAGQYRFTLLDNLDHHTIADHVENIIGINLDGRVLVTDTGDTADDELITDFTINVIDDIPVAFTPDAMTVSNAVQSSLVTEDIQFAEAAGSDGVGVVRFNFAEGAALTDTLGAAIYFNSSPVTLHYGSDNTILEARNGLGDVAFTIDLNGGTDTYSLDLNGTLYNVVPLNFTNVSGTVGGGNNTFKALGVGSGNANDIIISGNGTINSNNTEIGIGTGNDFGNGDIGRFDLRQNITVDAGNSNGTGFLYGDYYTTTSYKQTLSKVNSGAGGATFTVKAIIADLDTNFFGDVGDTLTGNITVRLYSSSNVLLNTFTNNGGGSVVVTGALQDNYFIVESTTPFNAVQIEGGAGETFKLGAISVGVASDLDPFAVSLPIVGTDGDGDQQGSNLTVNFAPPASPVTDLNGPSGGDDTTANFVEDGGAISIGTATATITDADSTHLTSMTVTLTNRPDGSLESLSLNAAATAAAAGLSVSYTAATGVLLIGGSAPIATYQDILRGVQYNNTDQGPTAGSRTINVVVSDGTSSSAVNTSTVTVVPANDAAVVSNVVASEAAIGFNIADPDSSSFFVSAPFNVASAFGNPTLGNNVSLAIPAAPGAAISGTLQINDGAGGAADVIGLYLGTNSANTGISAPLLNQSNAMYGFDGNDGLTGGNAADFIFGGNGTDTLSGGGGNDLLSGGANNDTLTGGTGADQFSVTSGTDIITDLGIGGVDVIAVSASATANATAGAAWTASAATSNSGTASVSANGFNINVSAATGSNGWTLSNTSATAVTLTGSNFADTFITANAGDTVVAGSGGDTVNITTNFESTAWNVDLGVDSSADKIVFSQGSVGDTQQTIATVSNFNVSHDKIAINLASAAIADGGFRIVSGNTDVGGDEVIELFGSASVATGSLTADGSDGAVEQAIATAIDDIAAGTYTVIVYGADSGTTNAGIYTMSVTSGQSFLGNLGTSHFNIEHIMTLTGVTAGSLSTANFVATADPLILDLGTPGIELAGIDNGVSFDINADGAVDQVAWTTGQDGILALDVNGNGTIDSGAEIFSPYFAGGDHASSLAALASLDSNGDGVMDANDAQFANLTVWQDLNHDGVSQANELSDLAAQGITSIDLQATPTDSTIDGQHVLSQGSFTTADGGAGTFIEVAFDTALAPSAANEPHTFVLDNANETASIADYSAARGDVIDVSGLLEAHFGENSQMSDFVNVLQEGSDVTIQIDQNGPASGAHFVDVAVLHGYGTSASDIVRIAFENVEQQIAV